MYNIPILFLAKPIFKGDYKLSNLNTILPEEISNCLKEAFINFDNNVFIAKSILNGLRVELYNKLFNKNDIICDNIEKYTNNSICNESVKPSKTLITNSLTDICDNLIYFPSDYNNIDFNKLNEVSKKCKVYLYLPAYITGDDLLIINKLVDKFYGVYVDGYWGLNYVKHKNLKGFVGVGMNIFNTYDYHTLKNLEIDLSKQ